MDGITREELKAMLEVQSKSTEQLTIIAKSLQDLVAEQKIISKGVYETLPDRVAEKVGGGCATAGERFALVKQTVESNASSLSKIKEDVFWLKIILGSATFIALLAQLILHVLGHKQ
jgi:hypothetical protein